MFTQGVRNALDDFAQSVLLPAPAAGRKIPLQAIGCANAGSVGASRSAGRSWVIFHGAPYLAGTIGAGQAGDQMQRHVDPRGNTSRRHRAAGLALTLEWLDGCDLFKSLDEGEFAYASGVLGEQVAEVL